jgi:hypothetical protein
MRAGKFRCCRPWGEGAATVGELWCEDQAFLRRLGADAALGSAAAAGSSFFLRPPVTGNSIADCWRSGAARTRWGAAADLPSAVTASCAKLPFSASIQIDDFGGFGDLARRSMIVSATDGPLGGALLMPRVRPDPRPEPSEAEPGYPLRQAMGYHPRLAGVSRVAPASLLSREAGLYLFVRGGTVRNIGISWESDFTEG